MNDHMFRKVGLNTRDERPGAKLRKRMVAPIGRHDVMTGLRAAVVAHDHPRVEMAGQKIGQETFSGVPKTKIDNNVCAQGGGQECLALKTTSANGVRDCTTVLWRSEGMPASFRSTVSSRMLETRPSLSSMAPAVA